MAISLRTNFNASSAPRDQRTASAYIFGAICPKDGKGAALVMPRCDTEAMNLHLAEIATQIAPGAHAALLVDQAGWHLSGRLIVPPNITIIPLPPKCPELNPQENIWLFMRENWLSNRIFKSFHDIVDHCCDAWNKLVDQPWRIMFLGLRDGLFLVLGRLRRPMRPKRCDTLTARPSRCFTPNSGSFRTVCMIFARFRGDAQS